MVNTASARNAWCSEAVTATRSDCGRPPKKYAVISEPKAKPKLMDICCSVLARVLAMAVSASLMSA